MNRPKLKSVAEFKFRRLARRAGWTVLSRGWPDFLVITPAGNLRFVEVKALDKLLPDQKLMLGALEKAGLRVEVWDSIAGRFVAWRDFRPSKPKPYRSKRDWFHEHAQARRFDQVLGV